MLFFIAIDRIPFLMGDPNLRPNIKIKDLTPIIFRIDAQTISKILFIFINL